MAEYWIAEQDGKRRLIMHHSLIDGRESQGVYCDAYTEERAERILCALNQQVEVLKGCKEYLSRVAITEDLMVLYRGVCEALGEE